MSHLAGADDAILSLINDGCARRRAADAQHDFYWALIQCLQFHQSVAPA